MYVSKKEFEYYKKYPYQIKILASAKNGSGMTLKGFNSFAFKLKKDALKKFNDITSKKIKEVNNNFSHADIFLYSFKKAVAKPHNNYYIDKKLIKYKTI